MVIEKVNYEQRLRRLNKIIVNFENFKSENILIFKDENIYYLTGFYGKNSGSSLLITNRRGYLFVNFIYYEEAKNSVCNQNIEIILLDNDKNEVIIDMLNQKAIKDILIEASSISCSNFLKLRVLLEKEKIKFGFIDYPLSELRIVKDEYELKIIRDCCRITEKSFKDILKYNYKEITSKSELELAHELEGYLIKNDAYGKSFDFIIANNENSSKPHYCASNTKIRNGVLLMDFGAYYKNYCSDITRTIFIGDILEHINFKKVFEIYEIVKEAQFLAESQCRPGMISSELDNAARSFIAKNGYGESFGHSLGHGVGLEVHEPPFINSKSNFVLREGMVITLEPGIYIEGLGGVRIEDMVEITKDGHKNFYNLKKEKIFIVN